MASTTTREPTPFATLQRETARTSGNLNCRRGQATLRMTPSYAVYLVEEQTRVTYQYVVQHLGSWY